MTTSVVDVTRVVSEHNDLVNGHDNIANTASKVFTPMDSTDNASGKTDNADPAADNINENGLPTADEVSKSDKVPVDANLQEKSQETKTNDYEVSEEAERVFLDLFKNLPSHMFPEKYMADDVSLGLRYISRIEGRKSLGWRTKNARNLSFVFHAYLRLIEDRITALEEGKLSLDNDENTKEKGEKRITKTVATVVEAVWSDFKRNYDQERNHTEEHAIEILQGDPAIPHHIITNLLCKTPQCCENDAIFDDLSIDHQRMEDFLMNKPWLTTSLRNLDGNPERIPEEDLILFSHRLFAFVLKDRKWAIIDINSVQRVPAPSNIAWNSLVLPEGHKSIIHSVVNAHFRDKKGLNSGDNIQTDLIRGKGKGLIILLHGAPGVGKTSTAECVAELCGRPLYPITCGDLGITAVEVESRLKRIFVQALRWKCVLLLDEADVFLSERGTDVKHNSLVSVFLRILEYYQGILFLTTNRVGKIDEAFRSRVHISLYYPPLDKQSTVDIFKTNLERVKLQKQGLIRTKDERIEEFAKSHYDSNDAHVRWNGRQIRNAFHIAVALAETEAITKATTRRNDKKALKLTLRTKHFLKVENASIRFDDYLTSVLGQDPAKRAKQLSNRQDAWSERHHEEQKSNHRSRGESKRKQRYHDTSSDSGDSSEESINEASISSDRVDVASRESRSESSNEKSESSEGESTEGGKRESKKSKGATRKQRRSRGRDAKGKSHSRKFQK